MAAASNIFETKIDVFAGAITGDVSGKIFQITDLFVVPDYFYVSAFVQSLDKVTMQNYDSRGMDTEKDDFTYIEATELYADSYQFNLTFWERQLEFYYFQGIQKVTIPRIRN